jgi:hypothetical protein
MHRITALGHLCVWLVATFFARACLARELPVEAFFRRYQNQSNRFLEQGGRIPQDHPAVTGRFV